MLEVPGFEADDVLGHRSCDHARDLRVETSCCHGDKDMLQLVGPSVRVLSRRWRGPGERVVYDEAR